MSPPDKIAKRLSGDSLSLCVRNPFLHVHVSILVLGMVGPVATGNPYHNDIFYLPLRSGYFRKIEMRSQVGGENNAWGTQGYNVTISPLFTLTIYSATHIGLPD